MLTFTVASQDDNSKLGCFLRSQGVSASLLRAVKYVPDGICVNGENRHTNFILHSGDIVSFQDAVHTDTQVIAQELPLDIVYEDEQVMVLNKPAGMAVHPTRNYLQGTLANAFCGEMQKRGISLPFRVAGRLDKNTSGLVVCALSAYSAPLLTQSTDKIYTAIAQGVLTGGGVIDAPIGLAEDSIIRRAVTPQGKPAVTEYEVLGGNEKMTLLRVHLRTGRTHQIRVHFASLGHPLAGDDFYGGDTQLIERHALHCGTVSFTHPVTGEKMTFTAPLPADMARLARMMKI